MNSQSVPGGAFGDNLVPVPIFIILDKHGFRLQGVWEMVEIIVSMSLVRVRLCSILYANFRELLY
jgi:hypothetical protein